MSKPLCVIEAPVFNRSGYGDLSTDLAKSILRYGKFDLKIGATRWGNCPSKISTDDLTTDEDRQLYSCLLTSNLNKQPDLFIKISIPNEFQPHGKYNIGITAGIETTTPKWRIRRRYESNESKYCDFGIRKNYIFKRQLSKTI